MRADAALTKTADAASAFGGALPPWFPPRQQNRDRRSGKGFSTLGRRHLDPIAGRFLEPDSAQWLDPKRFGGINSYVYCLNDPVTKEDPNGRVGLLTAMFIGAAVGGVLGFGAGAIKQISSNGWNPINWEWDKIGLSTLGGAVAGGLSAIHFGPVGSFREAITTFFFGGIGTTFGGYISGGVNNFQTAAIAFAFGGVANLAAYAFSSQLANEIGYRASGALTSKLYDVPLRDLVGTGLGGSGFSKAFISFSSHAAKLVSYAKGGWINTAACSFVNASVSNWLTSLL